MATLDPGARLGTATRAPVFGVDAQAALDEVGSRVLDPRPPLP